MGSSEKAPSRHLGELRITLPLPRQREQRCVYRCLLDEFFDRSSGLLGHFERGELASSR